MRASSAAITRGLPEASANASSVHTPTTGRFVPSAKPCATPQAMRTPVNEPGPFPNAIPSISLIPNPASLSNASSISINTSECFCPTNSQRSMTAPSCHSATEQYSVEVSSARIFIKMQVGLCPTIRPGGQHPQGVRRGCKGLKPQQHTQSPPYKLRSAQTGRSPRMKKSVRASIIRQQQHYRLRGDTFAAPGQAQLLGGGRFHVDGTFLHAQIGGDVRLHLKDMRCHLRCLGDDGRIDVADAIALLAHQMQRLAQQDAAVDVLVFRFGIGEMPADVAQCRGTQQRIADRMQQHVRVGMAEQTFFMGYFHPADDQLAACYQLMHIVTLTDTHVHFPC